MTMEIIDDSTAKFVLSRTVGDFIGQKFTSQADASDSTVAAALLETPGGLEVFVFGNEVTVSLSGKVTMRPTGPQLSLEFIEQ